MDKATLDKIIERHKGQPVGYGYIDIIIARENYKDFVADIVKSGFIIESISWWEWCPLGKESEYGLGGPRSQYYDGWFSELPIDVDDIKLKAHKEIKEIIREIIDIIETKTFSFQDETVTFQNDNWLIPAIWLDVPEDWRNNYSTETLE